MPAFSVSGGDAAKWVVHRVFDVFFSPSSTCAGSLQIYQASFEDEVATPVSYAITDRSGVVRVFSSIADLPVGSLTGDVIRVSGVTARIVNNAGTIQFTAEFVSLISSILDSVGGLLGGLLGRKMLAEEAHVHSRSMLVSNGELKVAVFIVNFVNAACSYSTGKSIAVSGCWVSS